MNHTTLDQIRTAQNGARVLFPTAAHAYAWQRYVNREATSWNNAMKWAVTSFGGIVQMREE